MAASRCADSALVGKGDTRPKSIVISNSLGKNTDQEKKIDMDWLLTVQRGVVDPKTGLISVGFGLISSANYEKMTVGDPRYAGRVRTNGGQVSATLLNSDYDYFSGVSAVKVGVGEADRTKLDSILFSSLKRLYSALYNFKPIKA